MDRMDALCAALASLPLKRNVPMQELTTFRVGGPADAVVWPHDEAEVRLVLAACAEYEVPCLITGNGSNLLVRDGGIHGLVLRIAEQMEQTQHEGNDWHVQAGRSLTALARETVAQGYQGLEWACGIPGTVGGACAMNAGAYGGELKQVLREVTVIENGAVRTHCVQDADMGYRTSAFAAPERVVLSARLALSPDDGGAAQRMADYLLRRQEKQPLRFPSAGSTFKRPEGHFAGRLIEDAGLKGYAVGGAQVSELHAGFVINRENATASDILRVIEHVQETVRQRTGISLECEVKIVGEG